LRVRVRCVVLRARYPFVERRLYTAAECLWGGGDDIGDVVARLLTTVAQAAGDLPAEAVAEARDVEVEVVEHGGGRG